jgi:hypothetical protein
MTNWSNRIPGKPIALSLIVIFTLTSCPMVTQTPLNSTPVVITPKPVTLPPVPDLKVVEAAIPAFFYLNNKTPTMRDRGRTGFMVANMAEAKDLVVVSEDGGAYPIVYFYGIEDISSVAIHFDRPGDDFPSGFVICQEEGVPLVTGNVSAYDEETETFSLDLDGGFETYDGLVLNKSLFSAYPDQGDLTESQYLRVRNIITSLALWTAFAYQTQDVAPAPEVLSCPSAELIVTSDKAVIVPIVTPVQVTVASVAAGIAAGMPEEPPPEDVFVTAGDTGPAGGILVFRLEEADGSYSWLEAAPTDAAVPARMINGEAMNVCDAYSVTVGGITGWHLPSTGEIELVYTNLYKEGMINCKPDFYWSSSLATVVDGITYYFSVSFSNGTRYLTSEAFSLPIRPVRYVPEEEIIAFKKAQG